MSPKICGIFNYAPHYRETIYTLMEQEMNIDFYFGDKLDRKIKKLDYSVFKQKVAEVANIWIYGPIYYQKGVVSLLFKKKYNKYIISGEFYCISTWLLLMLAKFSSKRVYLWTHGLYAYDKPWKKFAKRIYYGLCDGVFLYNNYTKEMMIKNGNNAEKLHVIHNSIGHNKQLKNRVLLKKNDIYIERFGNTNKVLLFSGRLTTDKKLEMLIDAITILKKCGEFYNLVLIGDGEERNHMSKYAEKMNLNHIWFYGACYDEKVLSNMIYNADLCVSPGNIGLMTIHALGYGTPVITHNNFMKQGPEFEAVTEGKTGYFFNYNDTESLAESISKWFKDKAGYSKNEIAEACYEVVDKFYNEEYQIKVFKDITSTL